MADVPPDPLSALVGIKLTHVIAGAAGGIVRSLSRPGGSWARHVGTAIIGTFVAGYGTPVGTVFASRYLASPDLPSSSVEGMVGFVLGLIGMSLCEAALRWARAWRDGLPPPLPPLPPAPP